MTGETRKSWLAVFGIGLLAFVGYMDFTIANTILPGIQRDLQASVGQLQWIMNSYIMMQTMFMVAMGRLGDIYGHRRVLYIGTLLFAVSSALAGAAGTTEQLILWRFMQGLAAALTMTASAALIPHIVPDRHRGLALGIYSSVVGCGLAIGPVVGGVMLTVLSWRWAFYINIPVVLVGLMVCWRALDESPRQKDTRLDWPGLALLVLGVGSLVTALMEGEHWGWGSPATLGLFALALIGFTGLYWIERRVTFPIIDFGLFRSRPFVMSIVACVGVGGCIGLGNFIPPLYLQNVLNEEPLRVGFMLMSISGFVVLMSPLAGRLGDLFGHSPFVVIGLLSLVLAAVVQAFFEPSSPTVLILVGLGLFGIGWGILLTSIAVMATAALPVASSGLALGVLWTVWDLSSNINLALGGLILETIDKQRLLASLEPFNLELQPYEHQVVSSLLSDPAQAKAILGQLSIGEEHRIFPLFQESFTAGYNGAMWYLAGFVTLCLLTVLWFLWRGKADAAAPKA